MKTDVMGTVRLHLDLKVDVEQLANWQPDRIEALFRGISLVQRAINDLRGVEQRGHDRARGIVHHDLPDDHGLGMDAGKGK